MFDEAIDVLPWPAISYDLKLIKNILGIVARWIYENFKQHDGVESLKNASSDVWNRFSNVQLSKLVLTMHNKIGCLRSQKRVFLRNLNIRSLFTVVVKLELAFKIL